MACDEAGQGGGCAVRLCGEWVGHGEDGVDAVAGMGKHWRAHTTRDGCLCRPLRSVGPFLGHTEAAGASAHAWLSAKAAPWALHEGCAAQRGPLHTHRCCAARRKATASRHQGRGLGSAAAVRLVAKQRVSNVLCVYPEHHMAEMDSSSYGTPHGIKVVPGGQCASRGSWIREQQRQLGCAAVCSRFSRAVAHWRCISQGVKVLIA